MRFIDQRLLNMLWRWGPAVLWMAVIFYFSHQPATTLDKMIPFFHKIFPHMQSFNWGHFVAYFILAITVYWGLSRRNMRPLFGKAAAVIICVLYGFTDEYHQLFIDGRHFDLLDIRNDAIGATLAMLLLSIPPLHRLFLKIRHHCEK